MSRNNNNNVSEKKYCKVCQDAGKSEAEFRSHFTRESRDPNSNVTCPLLLALECRYCYKNGHTVKYCPAIKEREKQNKREETSYRFYETSKKVSNPVTFTNPKQSQKNAFTCLNCDSDDEYNNVKNNNTKNNTLNLEFPELVQAKNTAYNSNTNNSYANALATAVPEPKVVKPVLIPVPVPVPVPVSLPKINYIPRTTVPIPIPTPVPTIIVPFPSNIKKLSTISWADMESDSSDEEEEYINSSPVNSKITMVNGYDSDW